MLSHSFLSHCSSFLCKGCLIRLSQVRDSVQVQLGPSPDAVMQPRARRRALGSVLTVRSLLSVYSTPTGSAPLNA
jgi:hypothetical protein